MSPYVDLRQIYFVKTITNTEQSGMSISVKNIFENIQTNHYNDDLDNKFYVFSFSLNKEMAVSQYDESALLDPISCFESISLHAAECIHSYMYQDIARQIDEIYSELRIIHGDKFYLVKRLENILEELKHEG